MNGKFKHLDMIQDTIKRMANNSFLLKGWTVTLVAALIALLAKEGDYKYLILAFFPIVMFWSLDGYFLRQERLFRKLFDSIRIKNEDEIDFSMDTSPYLKSVQSWLKICFSVTLRTFYLGMVLIVFALAIFIA